jgi:phosphohistidine swiveling domain-containing protein
MPHTSTTPPVLWLGKVDRTDLPVVGGKGAALGELLQAGLPVPRGFVVTTAAYRSLAEGTEVRNELDTLVSTDADDTAAVAEAAEAVRSALRDTRLPKSVEIAVREALHSIDDTGDAFYAVRSSATAEDLPTASFAGQHETYLGVAETDVLDRVRDCLASLYTDRAVAYRARNDVVDAEMAVVVQPMVDADAAGVLFTADPASGNRTLAAVDASFGLGEAVVGGEVTPDHALVEKGSGDVVAYDVAEKAVAVRSRGHGGAPLVDETATGVETVALPDADRKRRVLTDEQLRTLVGLGDRAETLLGAPQDVEWALADGAFVLLQSRPITSLFPLPTPLPDDGRLHAYLSMGHMQAMPEAMPPLVVDFWREAWVRTALEGLSLQGTMPEVTAEAGSRVYVDVTPVLIRPRLRDGVIDRLQAISPPASRGLADLLDRRAGEFERPGRSVTSLPGLVRPAWRVGRLAAAVVPPLLWNLGESLRGDPDPEEMEALWHLLTDSLLADLETAETPAERARAAFEMDLSRLIVEVYPRIAPLFLAFAIGGWLDRRFPDAPEDVNAVGRGFERDVVTRLNLTLGDLADVAREHPAVAEALRSGATLDAVADVEGGDAFVEAFEAFLDEFGHRATGEIDLSRPRWREDPTGLLAIVAANLANEDREDPHERVRRLEAEAEAATDHLVNLADEGAFGPARARLVRWLVDRYRATVYLREYPKHNAAHAFAVWRETFLDSGAALVDAGVLDAAEDVWFLRKAELLAALDGDPLGVDVDARKREVGRNAVLDAPPVLTSEGETIRGALDREDLPENALVGTGVSAGVVEGPARVVFDPRTATVEPGEILVAPSSDPGWTPLFLNAAGMVVEVGGPVSHGALVAREYGLPAVVSVPGATDAIRTGQRIRIDGTRGVVELLTTDHETTPSPDEPSVTESNERTDSTGARAD